MSRVTPNTLRAVDYPAALSTKGSNPCASPVSAPSPSMAVSIMALVVASTGTSYAAGLIGSDDIKNNSITTKDVKDGSLKGRDVKGSSIGSNKIRNGSLKSKDFKAGQLPAGAVGPAGPAGVGRWALVDATGAIIAQSGGFTVDRGLPDAAQHGRGGAPDNSLRANGNVYINAGENLANNGIIATIALQNIDQPERRRRHQRSPAPARDANAGVLRRDHRRDVRHPGFVNCAPHRHRQHQPPGREPAQQRRQLHQDGTRKRFYVVVTGDSSDRS